MTTYQDGRLTLTSRISYTMKDLIEKMMRLRHAQFDDPTFADGTEKIFYNVGWAVSDNIIKHTNIGTKDIQLISTTRTGHKIVPLIKFALREYLKSTQLVDVADDARKELVDMGHVVWKIKDGLPYTVSLLNLVVPPGQNTLQDGSFVERIELTWEEMLRKKEEWKSSWADIEQLWEYMQGSGRSLFTVYEFWHRDEYNGEGKGFTKGCTIYLDRSYLPDEMRGETDLWSPYIELDSYETPFRRKIRSKKLQRELGTDMELVYPYVERKLFKHKGRWLGIGIYELVSGILEHINMNWNLKRKFDELQFRGILVHKQPSMGQERTLTQEFLESIPSGGVIDVVNDEDLRRLDLGTITYDSISTNDALVQLIKMILGVSENIAGEGIKSNVTAAAINANVNLAETTYSTVVKQMGMLLRETFRDFLLEGIIDDMTMEDWLMVTGDPKELIQLEQPLVDQFVNTKVIEMAAANMFITEEMVDSIRLAITNELQSSGGVRWMQIPKDLKKLISFHVDFVVDGENFDTQQKIQNLEMMLNRETLTLNREELEKEELELMGLDTKKLQLTPQEKEAKRQAAIESMMLEKAMPVA